jgi:AraC-like DNA-binding protein
MRAGHAQPSASFDRSSVIPDDLLSEVLAQVRLTGALLFMVEAGDPWCVAMPAVERYRAILARRGQQVISYHVVLEGAGYATVGGSERLRFAAGDILVFPGGNAYRMESAPGTPPEFGPAEMLDFLRMLAAHELPFVVTEGGGGVPPARFLCGFLSCDLAPFHPVLAHLPPVIVQRRPEAAGDTLNLLIEIAVAEFGAEAGARPGGAGIRLDLSRLILIETLRRHLVEGGAAGPGWLGALADPVVGAAIRAIHANPAADWSLALLARQAAASRTVLAERFTRRVGLAPMQYLTAWRVQLAGRRLAEGLPVAEVAESVGYRSEAAFGRAFKRVTGLPPARWRADRRASAGEGGGQPPRQSAKPRARPVRSAG